MKSKALKDFDSASELKLWWWDTWLFKTYNDVSWKLYRKPFRDLKKMIGWYWNVFRFDYDFDGHCLFAIMEYKLIRLQRVLKNGHAVQEDKDMRALELAIRLAARLREDKYEECEWDRHDAKWGKSKFWFTPCEDKEGYSQFHSSRPNVITDQDKEEERQDFHHRMEKADRRRKKEEKKFYNILYNHLRNLWD